MLPQPTIDKLIALRLEPMVEAWRSFEHDGADLSFDDKLALMTDRLWTWRQNQALARRLQAAKLRANACVEGIRPANPGQRAAAQAMGVREGTVERGRRSRPGSTSAR